MVKCPHHFGHIVYHSKRYENFCPSGQSSLGVDWTLVHKMSMCQNTKGKEKTQQVEYEYFTGTATFRKEGQIKSHGSKDLGLKTTTTTRVIRVGDISYQSMYIHHRPQKKKILLQDKHKND